MLGATNTTNNGHSEELAPDGASAKAAKVQEKPMNMDTFHAFAAENPAAIATYIEQGKKTGIAETRAAEKIRFKAIREACGDNLALAVELFDNNKDADDAKIAVAAIARTKAEVEAATKAANEKIEAQAKEIERLTALNGTQGALPTGAPKPETPADKYESLDADARIQAEWDDNHAECVSKFKVFNAYRGFRVSQLKKPSLPTK
jgi:hypothetical protein